MLEVRNLSVRFGGQTALNGVSLGFEPGHITGVIGPNGAGKSTLFNVIAGFQAPAAGTVVLDGKAITGLSPSRRARLGLARTFQRLELFGSLTVRENIAVAVGGGRHRRAEVGRICDETLARFGLEAVADAWVATLPVGVGRVVELARAVVTRPRALLLDEPTSGLDEVETRVFDSVMRDLATSGIALAVVEHDIALVMAACNPIYVLDQGCVIACGDPTSVQSDLGVQQAYLGGDA